MRIRAGLSIFLLLAGCQSTERSSGASEQLAVFVKQFASGGGWGEYGALDDRSSATYEKNLLQVRDQQLQLSRIDTASLSFDEKIDWKFAQSLLAAREIEWSRLQSWKKDPRVYLTFPSISPVLGRPGEPDKKVQEVLDRVKVVSVQLANGKKQLEVFVPRFQELALFMAENGSALFDTELPEFIATVTTRKEELQAASEQARTALDDFISFLRNDLTKKPQASFSMGADAYNDMLRRQYLITYGADSLYNWGWFQFNKTVNELEALAKKIDPTKTWQELAVEIKNDHPDPYKMIEVHQEWVDKSREHVLKNNLIPIPWKERVLVTPRAPYLRKTSYYGNFSIAKEKDADSIFTSEMMINPFEDQWDEKRKQEYLVEHDWGVIIVTAPHETYAGHHVQGLYQLHNPRPLRRDNGISFFSEGWGLYNEQLMQETGFFPNERIHFRQLQLRLWRNARVIYDVGMHTGKMTYEEAIQLMTEKVGFLRWASQLEVDASSASPGYFIGYFTGMMEILAMREEYHARMGERFTLSDFHQQLLQIGNMPPALMREALRAVPSR